MKLHSTNLYYSLLRIHGLLLVLALLAQVTWADGTLSPPSFSHDTGFYNSYFKLSLSHNNSDAKIYYTLDGSKPDPKNIDGKTFIYKNDYQVPNTNPEKLLLTEYYSSHQYTSPILIDNKTSKSNSYTKFRTTHLPDLTIKKSLKNKIYKQINSFIRLLNRIFNTIEKKIHLWKGGAEHEYVDKLRLSSLMHTFEDYESRFSDPVKKDLYKGTTVRAIAIADNEESEVITKTYFIGDIEKFNTPIINLTLPADELYSYEKGIFVAGKNYDKWLTHHFNPRATSDPGNWRLRGQDTPVYLEIFDSNQVIARDIGMRIHGNGSRAMNQKNLRLYIRKQYEKGDLDYDIYGDGEKLNKSRIILRNGGDTRFSSYLSDFSVQRALDGLNFLTQRAKPYSVFINGEYHGLYVARDRHDIKTIHNRLNLPSRELTLRKENVNHTEATNYRGVNGVSEKGVHDGHWQEFMDFVKSSSKKSDDFYKTVNKYIDVNSYIDYQAAEIFIGNSDWLRSNIAYWRYAGSEEHPITEEGYTDGRWRWLMFDIDGAGGNRDKVKNPQYKALNRASKPFRSYSYLLRNLLKNQKFKEHFILRFADLLNTHFQAERMVSFIEEAREEIAPEMPRQIERWQTPQSYEYWNESVDELIKFYQQRPEEQFKQLEKKFSLKGRYKATVQVEGEGSIELNTLTLSRTEAQPWEGQYFNNMPLTLSAKPAKGYVFSHWLINGKKQRKTDVTLTPNENTSIKAVFTES